MLIWVTQPLCNLLMIHRCPQNKFEYLGMIYKYPDNCLLLSFKCPPASLFLHFHSSSPPNLHILLSCLSVLLQTLSTLWMPLVSLCQDLLMSQVLTLVSNGTRSTEYNQVNWGEWKFIHSRQKISENDHYLSSTMCQALF